MNTITLKLTIDVDGRHAADVIDDLAIDVDAGALDLALLNLLRDHFKRLGDDRDWRFLSVRCDVPEAQS